MNLFSFHRLKGVPTFLSQFLFLLAVTILPLSARAALTVTVVDDQGVSVSNFRWQLEEDNTAINLPYVRTNNTVSLRVHKSHAPVIAEGTATSSTWPIRVPRFALPKLVPDGTIVANAPISPSIAYGDPIHYADPDPAKRYILSILASGYSVGSQLIAAGQTSVTIVVNRSPLPTTQISVLVFNDRSPLNNEPDAEEDGLAGFRITFNDILGGPIIQDVFGNPLGTEYATDANGDYIPDPATKYQIKTKGDGFVYTDRDGKALIKNLWNGKFSVQAIPPQGENWTGGHGSLRTEGSAWQTATIEGTPLIDSWGAANGAKVFVEGWGSGFYHVFFGFVDPGQLPGAAPNPTNGVAGVTIKGRLRINHYGRPPQTAVVAPGQPVTDGWVGLNGLVITEGIPAEGVDMALLPANTAMVAMPCDPETGEFEIPNVAPGNYQLVSWDRPLDCIWNSIDVSVPAGGDPGTPGVHDIGDVLVVRWFGTLQGSVFYDANRNGFPDATEELLSSVGVNLRFRDGSLYQSTITKSDGTYSFQEVFPFFKWLVAEIDDARWKASGMTAVVDDGGTIPAPSGWAVPSGDINDPSLPVRNPQAQYQVLPDGTLNTNAPINNPNTGNPYSRTQTSPDPAEPLLTQALQVYNGQVDRLDWGKVNYAPGESGGISGIVSYNNTRAEADPRFGFQEVWDPGIPRVQVVLYEFEPDYYALATNHAAQLAALGQPMPTVNGEPADINAWKIKIQRPNAQVPRLADVDNYPFGWASGGTRGPEDVDRDDPAHLRPDAGRVFNPGDAIQITHTDSWDDTVATNFDAAHPDSGGWPVGTQQPNPPTILGRKVIGSDNFATWEQIRPGVFDGAYVLNSYYPGGIASKSAAVDYIPPGNYIVQACPPPGYLIQTEESRNIVLGDTYVPSKLALPPELAGDYHLVPPYLSLFVDQQVPSDFANEWRPLADRKFVETVENRDSPCNFNMYTEVPKAARVVGFVLNDVSAEFNPNNPTYGEREGAAWLPISFRDWAGHEVAHTYSDEFGCYDTLLPSTYNASVPCPSGFAPNMLTVVLNSPTRLDPANPMGPPIADPYYNPGYTIPPVTLEYYPGKVNYADTPIVPIGAFVGSPNGQLDVEPPSGTPMIKSVVGRLAGGQGGPWIASPSDAITITSLGLTPVLDPNYRLHGTGVNNKVIRDYGFGTDGRLMLAPTDRAWPATEVLVNSWTDSTIIFQMPASLPAGSPTPTGGIEWQLMIIRDNGRSSPIGVTLSLEPDATRVHVVQPPDPSTLSAGVVTSNIQVVIDAAQNGDLVIVPAIVGEWNEYLIMPKPIRLQGSGLGTVINGVPDPQKRIPVWHDKIQGLLGSDPFIINECPGIQVLGETNSTPQASTPTMAPSGFDLVPARIDGFVIHGAIHGGGINAYTRASNLRISNNRITGNMGDSFSGGISLGAPAGGGIEVGGEDVGLDTAYQNTNVVMEYNQILKNSSLDGSGGIAMNTGAIGYKIRNNYIEGNFCFDAPGAATSMTGAGIGGGGILHMGLCPGGLIADNVIAFNEVYFGYSTGGGDGGGISIQGESDGTSATGTSGSGSVTIVNNLIIGNLAGAGLGGGICLAGVNGPDVVADPTHPENWYEINIFNNMIVNNAAGFTAGGISLQDAIKVNIINNTIANNDSAAVALNTFPPNRTVSTPGGGGIVSHPNTGAIPTNLPAPYNLGFSSPVLLNDIIWHNRSYKFDYSLVTGPFGPNIHVPIDDSGGLILANSNAPYVDLFVVGGGNLNPQNCLLSGGGTPSFARQYSNTNRTALVYDEGGNNSISLRFEPIGLYTPSVAGQTGGGIPVGNYHLLSPIGRGANVSAIPGLEVDYDNELRTIPVDVGADQYTPTANDVIPGSANVELVVAIVGPPVDLTLTPFDEPQDPESNPLIPPGPEVGPPPNNPIWMTSEPTTRSFRGEFVGYDIQSLTSFGLRLQAQGPPVTSLPTLASQSDPVAKYIFDHLSGTWPVFDPDVGPPPLDHTTKGLLFAYTGGTNDELLADLIIDLNAMIQNGRSIYDIVAPPPGRTPLPGYFPTSRTKTLAAARPLDLVMLNRSVIQDAFTEVLRWYDPTIFYFNIVCGDGLAVMADSTELQIFGFSDQTRIATFSDQTRAINEQGFGKVFLNALGAANLPAPTIIVKEGQEFHLDLSNVGFSFRPDLFDAHTVHFHGFPQAAPIFDGMPLSAMGIHEGATFRYYYSLVFPGTYFYHCHQEATEHMQQGMIGNLWVLPKQNDLTNGTPLKALPPGKGTTHQTGYKYAYNDGDGSTYYDVEAPIQITAFDHFFHDQELAIQPTAFSTLYDTYPMLNGRGYPDTVSPDTLPGTSTGKRPQGVSTLITAQKGQRILLRISNVSETDYYTISVLGIPMTVIGKDARLLRGPTGKNLYYKTSSAVTGGGETLDIILDTSNTQPGTYFLYGTELNRLSNDQEDYGGLMTHIVITP